MQRGPGARINSSRLSFYRSVIRFVRRISRLFGRSFLSKEHKFIFIIRFSDIRVLSVCQSEQCFKIIRVEIYRDEKRCKISDSNSLGRSVKNVRGKLEILSTRTNYLLARRIVRNENRIRDRVNRVSRHRCRRASQ